MSLQLVFEKCYMNDYFIIIIMIMIIIIISYIQNQA